MTARVLNLTVVASSIDPRSGNCYFAPMHHKCLKVRMKMSPLEMASEEFVDSPLPSELTASNSYLGLAAKTSVSPLRMRT